jgi:hypothetical protein
MPKPWSGSSASVFRTSRSRVPGAGRSAFWSMSGTTMLGLRDVARWAIACSSPAAAYR